MNHNKTLYLQTQQLKHLYLKNKIEKMTHLNSIGKHVNYITIDHVLLLQNDNSDLNELTKCRTNHAILQ